MMLRCLAAAACCHAAHVKPYGICWTRNEASESHPAFNLGNLLRSATSARRASEGKNSPLPLHEFRRDHYNE